MMLFAIKTLFIENNILVSLSSTSTKFVLKMFMTAQEFYDHKNRTRIICTTINVDKRWL